MDSGSSCVPFSHFNNMPPISSSRRIRLHSFCQRDQFRRVRRWRRPGRAVAMEAGHSLVEPGIDPDEHVTRPAFQQLARFYFTASFFPQRRAVRGVTRFVVCRAKKGRSSPITSQSGTAPGSRVEAAARKPPHRAPLIRIPAGQSNCAATSEGASAPKASAKPLAAAKSIAIASSSGSSGASTIVADRTSGRMR